MYAVIKTGGKQHKVKVGDTISVELLEGEADLKVVGEAETGRQAVELVKKLRPAVVVMDRAINGLTTSQPAANDDSMVVRINV